MLKDPHGAPFWESLITTQPAYKIKKKKKNIKTQNRHTLQKENENRETER